MRTAARGTRRCGTVSMRIAALVLALGKTATAVGLRKIQNLASRQAKNDFVHRSASALGQEQAAEACMCVNEGSTKFTAPMADGMNQAWWNPVRVNDTYQDTPYGLNYTTKYGGVADYGEYCYGWEDECDSGIAGRRPNCTITSPTMQCPGGGGGNDIPGAVPPVDPTCHMKWCYIKMATQGNGDIAKADATAAPVCTNILATELKPDTVGDKTVWYSYSYCTTTTTTTTVTTTTTIGAPSDR
ncbi:unnamed protein product [Amoebophrya sp. A120]|nr:unnamed protein product [Amoebophrya sp. A120]|eukprot:GSA120T00012179001.1